MTTSNPIGMKGFAVLSLVGVLSCRARDRPDPIEVLAPDGGIMRPPPPIRKTLDGNWVGESGGRKIVLDLVDGLGYCDVSQAAEAVAMITNVTESGRVEFVVQTENGATFYWFARVDKGKRRVTVERIARWQDDPSRIWPVVPFELVRVQSGG